MQVEICMESTAFRPRIHEGDKDTTSADGSGNEEVGELRSPTADLVLAANEMREVSSALRKSEQGSRPVFYVVLGGAVVNRSIDGTVSSTQETRQVHSLALAAHQLAASLAAIRERTSSCRVVFRRGELCGYLLLHSLHWHEEGDSNKVADG